MRLFELTQPAEFRDLSAANKKHAQRLHDFILKHCGPWLQKTTNGTDVVYRGFSGDTPNDTAFVKKVRKDRKPRDASPKMHNLFNAIIAAKKKKANRSNSLFVTGNEQRALYYGTVYVILPIGKFNYTWNPEISDWQDRSHLVIKGDYEHDIITNDKIPSKITLPYLKKVVSPDGWKVKGDDNSLNWAINSGKEIMISCDSYIGIEPELFSHVRPLLVNSAGTNLSKKTRP